MSAITIPPTAETRPAPRHVIRVLIVDDNAADRELTVHWLGQVWPFERELSIVHSMSGEEALDRMLTMRLSLVIIDWNMPTMTGGELLERMRRYGVELPVVVLSGLERTDIEADLEALGAAFLNKNEVDAVRFENAIARALLLRERLVATEKAVPLEPVVTPAPARPEVPV